MKFYKNCKVWALINLVLSWGFPFGGVWLTSQIIKSVWISQSVETNQTIRMNQFYPVLEKFPAGQFPPVNFPRSNSPQVSNPPPPRWITTWPNSPLVNWPPVNFHLVKFPNPNFNPTPNPNPDPGGNSPRDNLPVRIWPGDNSPRLTYQGEFDGGNFPDSILFYPVGVSNFIITQFF